MAHFAIIDTQQTMPCGQHTGMYVVHVIRVSDSRLCEGGEELEARGIAFLQSWGAKNFPNNRFIYRQTSKNARSKGFRKNYAASGGWWIESLQAFAPVQPYNSWLFDEHLAIWKPPLDYPSDGSYYVWNEGQLEWDKIDLQLT